MQSDAERADSFPGIADPVNFSWVLNGYPGQATGQRFNFFLST